MTLSGLHDVADDLTVVTVVVRVTNDDDDVDGTERSDFNLSTLAASIFSSYNIIIIIIIIIISSSSSISNIHLLTDMKPTVL